MVHIRVGNRKAGNIRHIELVGLGPVSRVFAFHLRDSLLTATIKISICSGLALLEYEVIWGILVFWLLLLGGYLGGGGR